VEESAADVREEIQKALDVEPKEDSFSFTFGPEAAPEITIRLNGLRRDIGQTLQSTGLTLWRAGDFLSDYMYAHRAMFAGKSVLELGSGLGLVGILASYLTDQRVVITDGDDDTVELLVANCKLNEVADRVECRKLLWGEDLEAIADKFDILLGADIIYEQEYVVALFKTARHLMRPPHGDDAGSVFVLGYTKRNVSIDYVLNTASSFELEWTTPDTDEGMYTFRVKA